MNHRLTSAEVRWLVASESLQQSYELLLLQPQERTAFYMLSSAIKCIQRFRLQQNNWFLVHCRTFKISETASSEKLQQISRSCCCVEKKKEVICVLYLRHDVMRSPDVRFGVLTTAP